MVLVCKDVNQRFNINTYHNNLIKYKGIDIYNIVENKQSNIDKINNVPIYNLEIDNINDDNDDNNNKIMHHMKNKTYIDNKEIYKKFNS
jgi:hypothetical protein